MKEKFIDYDIKIPPNATGNIKTICPKCSHTRKKKHDKCLSVNVSDGVWNCHHCGWTGSLKNKKKVKSKMTKKTYKKPDWEPDKKSGLPQKVLKWFESRNISEQTLKNNDIQIKTVWMPQRNRKVKAIAFPYKENGQIVNIKYRDLKKNFRQSKNGKKTLFGLDRIPKNEDTLIITEGELDKLALDEAGLTFCVSIPGGAPSPQSKNLDNKFSYLRTCEERLKKFKTFILAVDNDDPGQKLQEELARRLGYEKCIKIKYPKDTKDPNDILMKYGKSKLHEVISSGREFPIEGVFTFSDTKDKLLDIYDNGYEPAYSTGFDELDEYYKVRSKEFTVITGVPSHGKSEFLDSIIVQMVNYQKWKFAIFSPENGSIERHQSKLIGKAVGEQFRKASRKEILKGIDFLNSKIHFIDPESGNFTIDYILEKTRSLIYRHGINALVIDPYNELYHARKRNEKETNYISRFLSKIRRFVRKHNIHGFIVAHPKKPDGKRIKIPTAYDIAGSANWFNKSDNIITVFRTEEDLTKIFIQKIRFAEVGRTGDITLTYDLSKRNYKEALKEKVPF